MSKQLARYLRVVTTIAVAAVVGTACSSSSSPTTSTSTSKSDGPSSASNATDAQYTIGVAEIAQIGPVTQMYEGFKAGLVEAGISSDHVDFTEKNANGDQSLVPLIGKQLIQQKPDLILSLGTPVTLSLAQQTDDIPIVFGAMTDPVGAGVVDSLAKPGRNLTGTSDYLEPTIFFDLLAATLPDAKRIGIIANPGEQNSASQVKALKEEASKRGVKLVIAPVANSSEVAPAAQSLTGRIDAAFLTQDNTAGEAFDAAAPIFYRADIPVIGMTHSRVEDGTLLASVGVDYKGVGVLTGKMAAKLLTRASKPATTPVVFANSEGGAGLQYAINTALTKHFDVTVPNDLLDKATQYDSSPLVK